MKRPLRFAAVFAIALVFLPFLPFYVDRTMREVLFADGSGGAIEWGWRRCALSQFWADYRYMAHEQNPALWLTVNVALAFTYALVIALVIELILGRKRQDNS
jgi:hypothetical protein